MLALLGRRWVLPILESLESGPVRRAELDRRLQASPASLTSAIGSLVGAGLVRRHQPSPRVLILELSDDGRRTLLSVHEILARERRGSAVG